MIELKEAIKVAKGFIEDVYKKPEGELEDSLLSAKKSETGNIWLISFRIPVKIESVSPLQNMLGIEKRITYKTIKIDENGNILEVEDDDPRVKATHEATQPEAA